uniref:EGF-like domain-containing protein n=1 Tax=Macrostomum lignano TaxID=282301 RepID=A0A1I8FS96_9PLAT
EHFWAIGSAPKGTDLQPWTSVGALPSGTNSQLVLTNGRKYFVSVRSVNNAGLATTYYDKIGLTVMTDPPELGNINASLVGVKDFDFLKVLHQQRRRPARRHSTVYSCAKDERVGCGTIYIKLHACTKAYVCANRTLSKQTIVPDESLVLQISSLKTQALPVEFRDADRLDMPEVKVIGSYPNGTSLYFEKLTDERTKADYDSSAASHYKPYIVHPEWTKHRTGRLLTRRIREFGTTFAISPIGRATIELQVARSQQLTGVNAAKRRTRRDAAEDETVDSLYWDADEQLWQLAGVFDTAATAGLPVSLGQERMFAMGSISKQPFNSAPVIQSELTGSLTVRDDVVVEFKRQLLAVDPEDDPVVWELRGDAKFGQASLSADGLLVYRPSYTVDELEWTERLPLVVTDQPPAGVPAKQARGVFQLSVSGGQFRTDIYFVRDGTALKGPVREVIKQEETDMRGIRFAISCATSVRATAKLSLRSPGGHELSMLSSSAQPPAGIDNLPKEAKWLTNVYEFRPKGRGHGRFSFEFAGVFELNGSVRGSDTAEVTVALLAMPCQNNGTCRGPEWDPDCSDVRRADGYEGYWCRCPVGWLGDRCELADPCALLRCDPAAGLQSWRRRQRLLHLPPGGDCETPPPGISLMDWLVPTLIALGVALVLAGAIIGAVMLRSRLRERGKRLSGQRGAQEMTERPTSSQQGSERAENTAQDADIEEVETAIDGSTDAGGGGWARGAPPCPSSRRGTRTRR